MYVHSYFYINEMPIELPIICQRPFRICFLLNVSSIYISLIAFSFIFFDLAISWAVERAYRIRYAT